MKGGGNLIIGAAFYIDGGGGRPPQRYGRSATVYGQSRTGFWPNDKLLTKFINICDYRFLIFIVIIVAAGACVDGGYEYCQCSRA